HRLRPQDRRGHAGDGATQRGRDPRVSGHGSLTVALLEVEELNAYYGQTQALHGVSFALEPGGITTLLGSNGAGKTTTLRSVCGMVRTEGSIKLDGRPIGGKPNEDVVRMGVGHVPEGRGTFTNLSVAENLRVAAYTRSDKGAMARDLERVL